MTERFELTINSNGQLDIIDHIESKEKNAICIYNDLGVLPFSSANALCDLLNKQDAEIKRLKKENRGIQFKIIDMLDFIKEKGTVTREEIKKWWNGDVGMTEKLLTVEELIKEFEKLPANTVVSVEYNEWLHNHPVGKIQVTLSIDDAKKLLDGDVDD